MSRNKSFDSRARFGAIYSASKGLFTWKGGNPSRWGNPPAVHIISHFN